MSQVNWAVAIAMQVGVVPLCYGGPGTAKTAFFRGVARAAKRNFLQCILRQMMPEDLGGIPSPAMLLMSDGKTYQGVKHLLSEPILRAQHEPTVLLFDEFNHAGHDVMGAAQEFINNPPANCWMAACANPVEQSTSGIELAPPVVNRMCVLDWQVPVDGILAGWESGFSAYPEPRIPIVPSDYLDQYGKAWGQKLAEFHQQHRDVFDKGFPENPDEASNPWPSYRSFTNVGKLMAACDAVGASKSTRRKLVRGCVGEAAALQWERFTADMELPDVEGLFANPSSLKLPNRFDRARAIMSMVINYVEDQPERWEIAMDLIEHCFDQNQELAMVCESKLWSIKPQGFTPRNRTAGNAKAIRDLRLANV